MAQGGKIYLKEDAQVTVHVKLDTGMGRIGIRSKEELKMMEQFFQNERQFCFEGIFTHFATADELDKTYFQKQLDLFQDMLSI